MKYLANSDSGSAALDLIDISDAQMGTSKMRTPAHPSVRCMATTGGGSTGLRSTAISAQRRVSRRTRSG